MTGLLSVVLPLCMTVTGRAASFDCGKATTAVEKMICADQELSKLDEEMAVAYAQAKGEMHDAPWFEAQQRLWLRSRNICGPARTCLEESYRKRLDGIGWYQSICKLPDTIVATYQYELEVNNDETVCRHMEKVYNAYFRQPWKQHPMDSKEYEENGFYSFPRLPGMDHFADYTAPMRHARRPSSPEFDAVLWREGRRIDLIPLYIPSESRRKSIEKGYQFNKGGDRLAPLLIADFDIDNDGKVETVVQDEFNGAAPEPYRSYLFDEFIIFPQGSIDPWHFDPADLFVKYRTAGIWPRRILEFSARFFVLNGVSYLSRYTPKNEHAEGRPPEYLPENEYIEVFRYHGGGGIELQSKPPFGDLLEFTQPQVDLVCRFRMKTIKQQ